MKESPLGFLLRIFALKIRLNDREINTFRDIFVSASSREREELLDFISHYNDTVLEKQITEVIYYVKKSNKLPKDISKLKTVSGLFCPMCNGLLRHTKEPIVLFCPRCNEFLRQVGGSKTITNEAPSFKPLKIGKGNMKNK